MTQTLKYEDFAAQLNTKFTLADASAPLELELIEATAPIVTSSQTYFSLYFRGDGNFALSQQTYRLEHEQLGELLIFLVPTARNADGFQYEAVFNLLNESQ